MDAVRPVNSSVAGQSTSDDAQLQSDLQVCPDYQDQGKCGVEDLQETPIIY